jgi:hypothetical protein
MNHLGNGLKGLENLKYISLFAFTSYPSSKDSSINILIFSLEFIFFMLYPPLYKNKTEIYIFSALFNIFPIDFLGLTPIYL